MKSFIMPCLSVILLFSTTFSQIPNAGFEQWNGEDPLSWTTSNYLGLWTTISPSNNYHSGNFAVAGQVVEAYGDTIAPFLIAGDLNQGFPISQQYGALNGYYQFSSVGSDVLIIIVLMYHNYYPIGAGEGIIYNNTNSYQQFQVPIEYYSTDIPNLCYLTVTIENTSYTTQGHPGTSFLIDDLFFSEATDIDTRDNQNLPIEHSLVQNYPNPFNADTNIEFEVPKSENVSLIIYNTLGQEIVRLIDRENLNPGQYSVRWEADDQPSGVYLYSLITDNRRLTKKMILVK